jgi:hypothetical protein
MEYGVNVWGSEGRLQENDRINKMSYKDIMNVYKLDMANMAK